MPWDLDRFYGRAQGPPSDIMFSKLKTKTQPDLPSRLFTIPLDVLGLFLERLTKQDAFRLSQTCKAFMRHRLVLKAIFYEPISKKEVGDWYRQLPNYLLGIMGLQGPPVTCGIKASTGSLVGCLAIPDWITKQDIKFIITHCPNLHSVDFSEVFKSVSRIWPPVLDRCHPLFANLRSVCLPYGPWKAMRYLEYPYMISRLARLPESLSLANQLRSLELTCRNEPTIGRLPESRRKASANLLAEILTKVSSGLTSLALYDSETTINNLDCFVQQLAVFPNLRIIKVSLHRDLYMYQKVVAHSYFKSDEIVDPNLSSTNKDYKHDTTSNLQYLSIIKKINDRGRFTIVSSDSGENYHYFPREYYGLSQSNLVLGPRDKLWNPIWDWNGSVQSPQYQVFEPSLEKMDIQKCRALFKELIEARIPVSLELGARESSDGALFAEHWDAAGLHRYNLNMRNNNDVAIPGDTDMGWEPRQHFINRRFLARVTSSNPPQCEKPGVLGSQPPHIASVGSTPAANKLTYADYRKRPELFRPRVLAARSPPEQMTLLLKQGGHTVKSIVRCHPNQDASHTINPKTDIPDPVWRLNEVGDLVDDLRLTWDRGFAYVYTKWRAQFAGTNPHQVSWSDVMHTYDVHLRDRLWRESEYTSLLFRRIQVDFPRLTRLALYIPAALYPDHDQTFINHALPGTGWTVRHDGFSVKEDQFYLDADTDQYKACLKLADDICPFISRLFTRPAPTDDPAAVIVHDDEWHVTKRPLFDLDGEYKSMEQLLTEPLRENYTMGES